MGASSSFYRYKLLAASLGNPGSLPNVSSYALALFRTACTKSALGTELSGGGYSRLTIVNNLTNFPAPISGVSVNGVDLLFAAATADWVPVVSWALLNGANCHFWGDVSPNVLILNGYRFRVPAGQLIITQDKD
jgi:hypothetical protein